MFLQHGIVVQLTDVDRAYGGFETYSGGGCYVLIRFDTGFVEIFICIVNKLM